VHKHCRAIRDDIVFQRHRCWLASLGYRTAPIVRRSQSRLPLPPASPAISRTSLARTLLSVSSLSRILSFSVSFLSFPFVFYVASFISHSVRSSRRDANARACVVALRVPQRRERGRKKGGTTSRVGGRARRVSYSTRLKTAVDVVHAGTLHFVRREVPLPAWRASLRSRECRSDTEKAKAKRDEHW